VDKTGEWPLFTKAASENASAQLCLETSAQPRLEEKLARGLE
jgi:hypothetical protein